MKCLVIQTAFLGDVILTLPLLRMLRGMPDVRSLAILTTPTGAEFMRTQDAVDRIVVYDKRGTDAGFRGFMRTVDDLRRCGFALAVVPHRSFRSALMPLLALVPDRVGFDESGGRLFLTKRVPYRSKPHEVERLAALGRACGAPDPGRVLGLSVLVPASGLSELSGALRSRGVGDAERIIVAAPGSKWATKRWEPSRFGLSLAELSREFALRPVVTGAAGEEDAGGAAASAAGPDAVDLTGSLSMAGWIALLGRADLVLSNDSAAAHVAVGAGTPVVAVFGPTVPAQGFAPYSERSRVVEAPLDCRPCGRHGSQVCRLGTDECMEAVKVEEVVAAGRELLEEGR